MAIPGEGASRLFIAELSGATTIGGKDAAAPMAPQAVTPVSRTEAWIGWGCGDFAPHPFHTTGRAVFRIRRLNPAEVTEVPPQNSRV